MDILKHPLLNRISTFLWLALFSASILSNPFISYPGRDSGIFLYIGSLILKGKLEGQAIRPGDTVVLASVGAGMNINSAVYRVPR